MSEVKITDLAAATNIDGNELFVASQNGNPVKITTDQIGYKYTSVINMDSLFPLTSGYYTLETAIAAVPSVMRKVGCEICFNDGNNILYYHFYGVLNEFLVIDKWEKDNIEISDIYRFGRNISTDISNYFLSTGGYISPSDGYKCTQYIKILTSNIFISGLAQNIPSSIAAVCFYDSNKTFISYLDVASYTNNGITTLSSVNIPTNAAYMRLGGITSLDISIYQMYYKDIIQMAQIDSKNDIRKLDYGVSDENISNYFLSTGGYISPSDGYKCTQYISISYLNTYFISGLAQNIPSSIAAVCFYDSNKTFISYLDVASYINNGITTLSSVNIPTNAAYIRLGGITSLDIVIGSNEKNNSCLTSEVNDFLQKYYLTHGYDYGKEIHGSFLTKYGYTYANSSYKYIDYIPVKEGVKIYGLAQDLGNTVAGLCFYDSSKTFISYLDVSSGYIYIDSSNIPTNATYMRLGTLESLSIVIVNNNDINLNSLQYQISNNNPFSNVFISLPLKMSVIEGETFELFTRSLINSFNYQNFRVEIIGKTGTMKFHNYKRKFLYTCDASDSQFSFSLNLYSDSGLISSSNECTIIPTPKKNSPSTKKNILMIGDSFTDQQIYPAELKRRLVGSGGTPTGDSLSNINFIGSRHTDNVACEGVSGMDYNYFMGSSSPFYNSSTSDIDFSNYMTNLISNYGSVLNISSGDKIDVVIIMLGTNKSNSETTIKGLWRKLISYNSNIKILVTGRVFCCPYGLGAAGGQTYGGDEWGLNKDCLLFNRTVESYTKLSEFSSNVFWVESQAQFDSENAFTLTSITKNTRTSDTEEVGVDSVHPGTIGYYQIADSFYREFINNIL